MGTSDAGRTNLAGPAVACTVGVYLLYALTRMLGADSLAPLVLLAGFLFAPMWMLRRTPQLARAFEVGPETPLPPWRWRGVRVGLGLSALLLPAFAVVFLLFYDVACGDVVGANGGRALGLGAIYDLEAASLGSDRVGRFVAGLCSRHNGEVLPSAVRWPAAWTDWASGGAFMVVLTEVLLVAVPEEVFHRGYLMSALEARWPPKHRVLGVKIGMGAVVSSAMFAVGHLVGDMRIDRLATFFPALLFAWIWRKSGSLWAAIIFHAASNLLMQVLLTSTFPSP